MKRWGTIASALTGPAGSAFKRFGFRAWDLGLRVLYLGFAVQGLVAFGVEGLGFRV